MVPPKINNLGFINPQLILSHNLSPLLVLYGFVERTNVSIVTDWGNRRTHKWLSMFIPMCKTSMMNSSHIGLAYKVYKVQGLIALKFDFCRQVRQVIVVTILISLFSVIA